MDGLTVRFSSHYMSSCDLGGRKDKMCCACMRLFNSVLFTCNLSTVSYSVIKVESVGQAVIAMTTVKILDHSSG